MKIFATLLWAFWMLVVVPGHERGILPLCPACAPSSSTATLPACCQKPSQAPGKPAPAAPSSRGCAICNLTANLGTTPSLIPILLPLRLQSIAAPPENLSCADQPQPADGHCRGPPAA